MLRLGSIRTRYISNGGFQLLKRSFSMNQSLLEKESASKVLLSGKLGSKLTTAVLVIHFNLI